MTIGRDGDVRPAMTCLACGSDLAQSSSTRKGYAVVHCRGCGLSRIDPIPGPTALADYYSRVYALAADAARVDVAAYQAQGAQVARVFARWAPGARRVCEVGCSGGWALKELQRRGYTVKGYELSATTARLAREQLGLDVVTGEFTREGDPFDIILMRHVLEHTRDPFVQLEAAAARLTDGGTVFIAVPNGAGLSSRLLGQYWSWYIPPAHLWYFTPRSLSALVRQAGLVTRWVETRQGDANNPVVEIGVGLARWVRQVTHDTARRPAAATARETLANLGPLRGLVNAANVALAPVSFVVSAAGLGDELWIAATKTGATSAKLS